ncbi:hypothetical protein H6F86_30645 [Phormidium sp. FACHB-592]|uniref:Uncharacterized protein n=1 Tax=Stenomitos frigidus AS-A4 TaxID=2933935 RepID=A0ABV0KJ38_9CYAN|nr:hypothetical protein [Phormidium sp. FACHB-592]MBD2078172.1 hypothetical protein [Phormidium sp. FACHB-592]
MSNDWVLTSTIRVQWFLVWNAQAFQRQGWRASLYNIGQVDRSLHCQTNGER